MNSTNEITSLSALTLSALIRERELSCVEVTEAFLKRIDSLNPTVNAFCTIAHEVALAAAAKGDENFAKGRAIGPLHGLPIALKDLTPTRGIRTTRGSLLYADHVPETDAGLVHRLKSAGAIIVGKTNTSEFGHKAVTDNLVFGPTRNPWSLDRIAGGSSGGSAAAVAAGLVPFAEGSDGAGSIRIPASLCGVFGFKPTYGRVPDVAGAFSSHAPFFHNGPLARSVADGAFLYQAMTGEDWSHPFSIPTEQDVLASLDTGIAGLRVGFSFDLGRFEVTDDVKSACLRAVNVFESLGCTVEEASIELPPDIETMFYTLWRIKLSGAYAGLADHEFDLLDPVVQTLIRQGKALSASDYSYANRGREIVWGIFSAFFSSYDLLICPTTAIPAFASDSGPPATINGVSVDPLLGWLLTYPFNLTGNPAASIPCPVASGSMPIGIQVIGRRLADSLVLRACRAFERVSPWPRFADIV
ncbi:amidase [Paraburkholderia sartisoli]|uniref:Aspartyl-tRNA(Asn)/glutamyl-tRNA(Gln) amidotransferase subunit A n=1 Tax=Paraburkholderia sartisoli TaxID=83784 RepID=A0A1H4FDW8_9BURK|nr:amidase [Paraburkholderia sartisoli]SEA95549.1 aspartyl-tRNA(Asn)/glutamyl-tRNA(Gln) amidotransferase subunit A [Paraburkholderia sartisoli]